MNDLELVSKVTKSLMKLRKVFGSANDLAEAIKEFGLFTGKAFYKEDGWGLDYTADILDNPYASAVQGWAYPTFGAFIDSNGHWNCSLGYGIHSLDLAFDENGNVVKIEPDDSESDRCWQGRNYEERIEFIKQLLNS
jgi:hypothetical protein